MLKGAHKDLAFLTDGLGCAEREGNNGERNWSEEGRRRAVENGPRKYKGEAAEGPYFVQLQLYEIAYFLGLDFFTSFLKNARNMSKEVVCSITVTS